MKKKLSNLLFYSFWIFLLSSCEFDSDEVNFIEVKKPDENTEMHINLNDIEPGETIILFEYSTYFNFTLDVGRKTIKQVKVKYGTTEYDVYVNNGRGEFSVDRNNLENYESGTLSLEITTSSGSGSIADIMGFEGYMGKVEYNLKYIGEIKDFINIKHRKNEQGFLELYWNDLKEFGINVTEYKIYDGFSGPLLESTEGTSYVDKSYIMNYKRFTLEVVFSNGNYGQRLDYEVNEFYNSEISVNQADNNLSLSWEQPKYKCQYIIEWQDLNGNNKSDILPYETLNFNIPYNPFDGYINGTVYFVPVDYTNGSLNSYNNRNFYYDPHYNGIGSFIYHAFNPIDNIIYLGQNNIRAINLKDMSTVSNRENDNEYFYLATSSYVSSKTAFAGYQRIFVFPNSALEGPIVIQNKYSNKKAMHFTSKDYLVLYSADYIYDNTINDYIYQNILSVYDAAGLPLYEFKSNKNTEIEYLTGNGDYIVLASKDGIEIYNLSNSKATLVHEDNGYYKSAQRLPGNSENILLKEGDYFTIRRMSDFSLITKSDAFTNVTAGNIDPITKKVLVYTTNDSKTFYLLNIDTLEKVYQRTFENYYYSSLYLYNGILITSEGNYYNINNEIK